MISFCPVGGHPVAGGDSGVASGSISGKTLCGLWSIAIEVDGVDVSDFVVSDVVVEAEEGVARIADFSLAFPASTTIVPAAWIGRGVTISVVFGGQGSAPVVIFTGLVDFSRPVTSRRQLDLRCTDDLQGLVSGLSSGALRALITGARWSPAVFDASAGGWALANDMLSTVDVSLDASPLRELRVTGWAAKDVADVEITAGDAIAESVDVEIAERSAFTNSVAIDFGYRIPRLKSEGYLVTYDYIALHQTSFVYWVRAGNSFLQRAAVEAAIAAAGGTIVAIEWIPLPTTAQIIPGTGGAPAAAWLPNAAVDALLCLGFSAVVSFDYAQINDETHRVVVECPRSIDAVGMIRDSMSGALEGAYADTTAIEQNVLLYRQKMTTIPPRNLAPVIVGLTNSVDPTLTADTDRAAATNAIETLVAVAKTKIRAAHRGHNVRFSVPCMPDVDTIHTLSIAADGVVAKGKCRRVVHRLSANSGAATTDIELAISSIAGVGIVHQDDEISVSQRSAPGVSNVLGAPVVTWNGLAGEDQSISIVFPGVEAAERDKATHVFDSVVRVSVPEDMLEIVYA